MFPVNNNNNNNNNNNYNNNIHNRFSTYIAHSKTCPNGFYNKEKISKRRITCDQASLLFLSGRPDKNKRDALSQVKRRSVLNSRSSSGLFITKDVVVSCT